MVASGCQDGTCEIVRALARDDERIRLLEQAKREGKAAAINLFLASARGAMLLMASADLVVKEGTVDALLRHFEDPTVGMVGGHPTPVNSEDTFLGHSVHLQWRLHDRNSPRRTQAGGDCGLPQRRPEHPDRYGRGRDLDSGPGHSAWLPAGVRARGRRVQPRPRDGNRPAAPATAHLRRSPADSPPAGLFRLDDGHPPGGQGDAGRRRIWHPKAATFSIGAVGLEAVARALGHCDAMRGGSQHVWAISATTKRGIADRANAHDRQTVAVFHIIDFHRHELELGLQAGRQLARLVVEHVRAEVGPEALVSLQRGALSSPSCPVAATRPSRRSATSCGLSRGRSCQSTIARCSRT